MTNIDTRAGYVALIGKPNVGKSTLLNQVLGKKVSITSSKPQTTRQRVIGIKTAGENQVVYLDTPGIHSGEKSELNRYMNRVAKSALHEVDLIVFMVDVQSWDQQDERVLALIKQGSVPALLVVNKVDRVTDKATLLPLLSRLQGLADFKALVPVSAKSESQVADLERVIIEHLPHSEHFYPPEQFTDRSDRFIAAEFIREKLMRYLGQELPYQLTVTLEAFELTEDSVKVGALIWLEKESHKPIVIGKGGSKLKKVGTLARLDIARYFDCKAVVKLWVKVKTGWSDDKNMLNQMGYRDGE